jgi:hypothetical protein
MNPQPRKEPRRATRAEQLEDYLGLIRNDANAILLGSPREWGVEEIAQVVALLAEHYPRLSIADRARVRQEVLTFHRGREPKIG